MDEKRWELAEKLLESTILYKKEREFCENHLNKISDDVDFDLIKEVLDDTRFSFSKRWSILNSKISKTVYGFIYNAACALRKISNTIGSDDHNVVIICCCEGDDVVIEQIITRFITDEAIHQQYSFNSYTVDTVSDELKNSSDTVITSDDGSMTISIIEPDQVKIAVSILTKMSRASFVFLKNFYKTPENDSMRSHQGVNKNMNFDDNNVRIVDLEELVQVWDFSAISQKHRVSITWATQYNIIRSLLQLRILYNATRKLVEEKGQLQDALTSWTEKCVDLEGTNNTLQEEIEKLASENQTLLSTIEGLQKKLEDSSTPAVSDPRDLDDDNSTSLEAEREQLRHTLEESGINDKRSLIQSAEIVNQILDDYLLYDSRYVIKKYSYLHPHTTLANVDDVWNFISRCRKRYSNMEKFYRKSEFEILTRSFSMTEHRLYSLLFADLQSVDIGKWDEVRVQEIKNSLKSDLLSDKSDFMNPEQLINDALYTYYNWLRLSGYLTVDEYDHLQAVDIDDDQVNGKWRECRVRLCNAKAHNFTIKQKRAEARRKMVKSAQQDYSLITKEEGIAILDEFLLSGAEGVVKQYKDRGVFKTQNTVYAFKQSFLKRYPEFNGFYNRQLIRGFVDDCWVATHFKFAVLFTNLKSNDVWTIQMNENLTPIIKRRFDSENLATETEKINLLKSYYRWLILKGYLKYEDGMLVARSKPVNNVVDVDAVVVS